MSEDREIIDQLASTGTYVTRDGDGVLRHWNGITLGFVNTWQAGTMTVPNDTGDKATLPYDATAAQIHEATGVRVTIPDGPPYVIGRDYHLADENYQPIVTTYDIDGNRTAGPAPWSDLAFDPLRGT